MSKSRDKRLAIQRERPDLADEIRALHTPECRLANTFIGAVAANMGVRLPCNCGSDALADRAEALETAAENVASLYSKGQRTTRLYIAIEGLRTALDTAGGTE